MRIYFCDKCNESIPLKDMQSNRVTIEENKIFCTKCAPRPSKVGQLVRLGYTVLLPALLCTGVGMVAMAFWGDRFLSKKPSEDLAQKIQRVESSVVARLDAIDVRQKAVEAELAETTNPGDRPPKVARLAQSLRENADAIQQLRQGMNGFKDEVQGKVDQQKTSNESLLTQIQEDAAKRAALLEHAITEIEKTKGDVDLNRRRIEDVAALAQGAVMAAAPKVPAEGEKSGGGGGAPKAGPGTAAPTPNPAPAASPVDEKKLQEITKKLADKDPSKRFAAVFELFDMKGRRAEEALVGVFGDATDFVQTAAMGCLGDMNAQWTIPNIIPKMKDENTFIRQAAIEALEKLTGLKLDVTPESGSSKLAAKARDLDKWWAENKVKITGAK